MKIIAFLAAAATAATALFTLGACQKAEVRTPPAKCWLAFTTLADWRTYTQVMAQGDHAYFNQQARTPSNFPWTAMSATGFGGVLIVGSMLEANTVSDPLGTVHIEAFDASCPVENKPDVRIVVDEERFDAYCPKCGSRYDVFMNRGSYISGPAADLHYNLRRFAVGAGRSGQFMVIEAM